LVRVALVNTRIWDDVGLQDVFHPTNRWQKYEFYFQSTSDLRAEDSRLQIWFNSTGTLWLDDVELREIPSFSPQRLPKSIRKELRISFQIAVLNAEQRVGEAIPPISSGGRAMSIA
jgi:hypothetical protein